MTEVKPLTTSTKPDLSYIDKDLHIISFPIFDFNLDPDNALDHENEEGDLNIAGIKASLKAFGQQIPIIVKKEGMIVKVGNGRLMAARLMGWSHIAAKIVADKSESWWNAFSIAENRSREGAKWNERKLVEVMSKIDEELRGATGFSKSDMEGLAKAVGADSPEIGISPRGNDGEIRDEEDNSVGGDDVALLGQEGNMINQVWQLSNDAAFASNNEWGIPDLREDMMSDAVPTGTWDGYGSAAGKIVIYRTGKLDPAIMEGSILSFYTDDWRFEGVWANYSLFLDHARRCKFAAVMSPDFSLWSNMPPAIQIYNRFRGMWMARYWQEIGVKIIPSMAWTDQFSMDWCMAGLPQNCPVVALQCRTAKKQENLVAVIGEIKEMIDRIHPQKIIMYGLKEQIHKWKGLQLPEGPEYIAVESFSAHIKARRTAKERARASESEAEE